MEGVPPLAPEEHALSLGDKFLIGQKMFRLAVADVLSTVRDAFVPADIKAGESLFSYLGERAEARKQADEAQLRSYILEKGIGSLAARQRLENGFTDEFFR